MTHYFAKLETINHNVNKFLFNLLIKAINKKPLYYNANKWMQKLSAISWEISKDTWTEYKFQLENGVEKVAE